MTAADRPARIGERRTYDGETIPVLYPGEVAHAQVDFATVEHRDARAGARLGGGACARFARVVSAVALPAVGSVVRWQTDD